MTYDMPFKLRVMHALTQALQEITPANGYEHDLSAAVFRGRLAFGDDDPIPMVSILEAPLPLEQKLAGNDGTASKGGWNLLIQGFVRDDKVNPTDPGHYLMADVRKRIALLRKPKRGSDILGMAGNVTDLRIGPGVVRPPGDDVSSKAYFWMTLTLDLVEDLEKPYD